MSINILNRFERFRQELGSSDPVNWKLEEIDQTREALLGELEAKHLHLKTVEEAIFDHQPRSQASQSLRNAIGGSVHDCFYRYRYGMPMEMADCYLDFARGKIGRGDEESAARALMRVLRFDVTNRLAHDMVDQLAQSGGEEFALGLRQRFRFRYVRSFGHTRLKLPYIFRVDREERCLLICDAAQRQVLVYSLGGRFIRAIELDVECVVGITSAKAGGFWVCDTDKKRVVRRDIRGKTLEEFTFTQRDCAPRLCSAARAFERDSEGFVAAGVDEAGRDVIGELTRDGFRPFDALAGQCLYLVSLHGQLFLRDHYSGRIFKLDPLSEQTTEVQFDVPRLNINYGFDCAAKGWFMVFARRALAKFTPEGKLEFIVHLENILGNKSWIYDVNVVAISKREYVYLADPGARCMHIFEI